MVSPFRVRLHTRISTRTGSHGVSPQRRGLEHANRSHGASPQRREPEHANRPASEGGGLQSRPASEGGRPPARADFAYVSKDSAHVQAVRWGRDATRGKAAAAPTSLRCFSLASEGQVFSQPGQRGRGVKRQREENGVRASTVAAAMVMSTPVEISSTMKPRRAARRRHSPRRAKERGGG